MSCDNCTDKMSKKWTSIPSLTFIDSLLDWGTCCVYWLFLCTSKRFISYGMWPSNDSSWIFVTKSMWCLFTSPYWYNFFFYESLPVKIPWLSRSFMHFSYDSTFMHFLWLKFLTLFSFFRNEKSHQICKMRRCDRLTEKKVSHFIFFSSDYFPPFLLLVVCLQ